MVKKIIIIALILKLFFVFFVKYNIYYKNNVLEFQFLPERPIGPDEIDIANIAYNINTYGKHVRAIKEKGSDKYIYNKTTYRPLFPIYMHVFFQKIYKKWINPELSAIEIYKYNNHIKYYQSYSYIINILSLFFFVISIFSFLNLLKYCNINTTYFQIIGMVAYILFPSSLIYIGMLTLYENIATPCLVIFVEGVIAIFLLNKKKTKASIIWYICCILFATLIRPQLIIPVFFIMALMVFIKFIKYYKNKILPSREVVIFTSVVLIVFLLEIGGTIVYNYYKVWNKPVYTTRGDAFLWGHNPFARGCWDGSFDIPGSVGYIYQSQNIPNFTTLNELESSNAKAALAKEWIKMHPKEETILILRKVAIFLLPYHFEYHSFSIILFVTYILSAFFVFILLSMYFKDKMSLLDIIENPAFIIYLVFLSVLFVNVYYFVEYRMRYFADPFMLLLALVFVQYLVNKIIAKDTIDS